MKSLTTLLFLTPYNKKDFPDFICWGDIYWMSMVHNVVELIDDYFPPKDSKGTPVRLFMSIDSIVFFSWKTKKWVGPIIYGCVLLLGQSPLS
jgi:hypothetical protein